MSTYGKICFETAVQYAPGALPGLGPASTCPAPRQALKISASRGEKRPNDVSTTSTASGPYGPEAYGVSWSQGGMGSSRSSHTAM